MNTKRTVATYFTGKCLFYFQRIQKDFFHYLITLKCRMASIFRKVCRKAVLIIFHWGMVVNIDVSVLCSILLDHGIQLNYLTGSICNLRTPAKSYTRENGAQYRLDFIGFCDITHRNNICKNVVKGNRPVIKCNIISSRQDDSVLRRMNHHILSETAEHVG